MKRLLSVILAAMLLVPFMGLLCTAAEREPLTSVDKLSVRGRALVNQNGEQVILKGTNIGGWLLYEQWMCPANAADNTELYDTLIARFGEEKAAELINRYLDNWLTEADLDKMAEAGFNCVRVPFWYRNLMTADYKWIRNSCGQIDFSRLDWIVDECAKRGIYVILDLHGAPGFQSDAHASGKTDSCELYDSTQEGARFRRLTAKLWTAVASHYRNNPAIACYDLLNEPTSAMDETAYRDRLGMVYETLYRAVRLADCTTPVSVECIWYMDKQISPYEYGWKDVIYQIHVYNYDESGIDGQMYGVDVSQYYNVPVLAGETNAGDVYPYFLEQMNRRGISWTTWCYKGGFTGSTWFMYSRNFSADGLIADVFNDSYETIYEKWGDEIRTENMQKNAEFIALLTSDIEKGSVPADETAISGEPSLKSKFKMFKKTLRAFYYYLTGVITDEA